MFLQVALSPGFETFMNFRSDGPEIYLSMDSLSKETLVKIKKNCALKDTTLVLYERICPHSVAHSVSHGCSHFSILT